MEISENTKYRFYIGRVFGLAPYKIKSNKKIFKPLKIYGSGAWTCYSIILNGALVLALLLGAYYDIQSKKPLRLRNMTSKIVTGLDITCIGSACLWGCLSGILGLRNTQEFNRRLSETDETLSNFTKIWVKKDKFHGNIILLSVFGFISCLLNIYGWLRIAQGMMTIDSNVPDTKLNVLYFLPVYLLYLLLMALQVQVGLTSLEIGRRYRHLNIILTKFSFRENMTIKNSDIIDRLAYTHESLGKAMVCVSNTYGITMLVLLASCLLHLVVTSYFFFIELNAKRDAFFSLVQFLWLMFHISRLIFLVEPCHVTSVEACKTINIVCSIMRSCKGPLSLKRFWQQLLSDKAYFSACGMCTIDRQILTSISGACATYLVILIQFHLSSGDDL